MPEPRSEKIAYCYRVLDLKDGCSIEDVKTSYRVLVKVWHPDRFAGEASLQQTAEEKLKEINVAYELLLQFLSQTASNGQPRDESQSKENAAEIDFCRASELWRQCNYKESVELFKKAAAMGHPKAEFVLGSIYEDGEKVGKDIAEAVRWYTKAAKRGVARAQYSLGVIYFQHHGDNLLFKALSHGVDFRFGDSKLEAFKWFNLALTNGVVMTLAPREYKPFVSFMDKVHFELSKHLNAAKENEARVRAVPFYPNYPSRKIGDAIAEWMPLFFSEIKQERTGDNFLNKMMRPPNFDYNEDLKPFIIEQTHELLKQKFAGKAAASVSNYFKEIGSGLKLRFGSSGDSTDKARLIAASMVQRTWVWCGAEYLWKRENLLNELWLKIYHQK